MLRDFREKIGLLYFCGGGFTGGIVDAGRQSAGREGSGLPDDQIVGMCHSFCAARG